MLKIKIPLILALVLCVSSAIAAFFVSREILHREGNISENIQASSNCNYNLIRLNGYQYVSPLLFSEGTCPTPRLNTVTQEIQKVIDNYRQSGKLADASVYVRHLQDGDWLNIGEGKYLPGSLMKIPELITFMKMNEKSPGLLNKTFVYNKPLSPLKSAVYTSRTIELGKSYTIRELLYYMIAYSDNNASMVLNSLMDLDIFKKTFTDLGMNSPDLSKKDIPLTAREISLFMRAIYNASYLSIADSEYCAELLGKSSFADGLLSGLPRNTKVMHKFGEAGDQNYAYFGETAIVYANNGAYLLTVMTKGKQLKELPAVVSAISGTVYGMNHQL